MAAAEPSFDAADCQSNNGVTTCQVTPAAGYAAGSITCISVGGVPVLERTIGARPACAATSDAYDSAALHRSFSAVDCTIDASGVSQVSACEDDFHAPKITSNTTY